MSDEVYDTLYPYVAEQHLKSRFYTDGMEATVEGFTLTVADHSYEIKFEVNSAGILVLTNSPTDVTSILLVSEDEGRWDIPSGKVEYIDRNPKETAIREFSEETRIVLDKSEVLPLTFAFNIKNFRAGVQYFSVTDTSQSILGQLEYSVDKEGRCFYELPQSVGLEQNRLVLEPLELFMRNPKSSLLSLSHHKWAYRLIRDALSAKANLVNSIGYENLIK